MAVELPEPLQWVLLLLAGCRWPEADEDQLRDMADHCRKAAETLKDAGQGVDAAIKRAVEGQQGNAAEALTKYWATYTVGKGTDDDPGRLTATIKALDGMGNMLEQMANSAETAKIQIVAQLGILAFELATAEAEAPITAGASMLQVPGFIAAARAFVQTTLKTLLKDMIKMAAKQAAQMAAINLMAQGIELAEGHRKSIDWKEVGENAKGGAIGGAAGHLIGAGLGGAAGKMGLGNLANSAGGKMAIGAATGVGADAATQYITTGKVDTSSLLGSGLSGGAGAGLSHMATRPGAHPPAPKPGDAPHIPGPVGPGEGGRQDGPPKFTKPDTSSGDSGSSYHGPSSDAGSSNSSGTKSRSDGWDTSDSSSSGSKSRSDGWDTNGSNSSGSKSRSDGWDTNGSNSAGSKSRSDGFEPSSSHSGGGNPGSGESRVGGLSPFGSGRSGGDTPPSHSEGTGGGGRSHEQAPPTHEQSAGGAGRSHEQAPPSHSEGTGGGGRSHEQAPPTHEQSAGGAGRSHEQAPPSHSEATGGAGRSHEQAPPTHEQSAGGGRTHEQPEAIRQTREPVTEQTPSRPAHEEPQAVRPSAHEPLSGQEPSRPVHEQPVRHEAEGQTVRPDSRESGAPVREEPQAVRPTAHEPLSSQEPSRPAHDNSSAGRESSANDRDSVQPSGDDSASRPAAGGPVPNLSGVLGGAAHLASAASSSGHGGGSSGGGTHLDGARSATLPRPDAATVPGQGMPDGIGDTGPNSGAQSPNQTAVPPMGGAGFASGPGGGGSHIGGGARPDAPSTSAAPRPANAGGTVGNHQQGSGGGTLRPGGGRGTSPETHPAPAQQHASSPKPTEHNAPTPHEQQPHERPATEHQGEPRPRATDKRPIDQPGGLKEPTAHDRQRIEDAVPHDENGKPRTHPDPLEGDWVKQLNGDGHRAPGRNNNCADAALSFKDTYDGHPTPAAPRVENNGAGEKGGRDRIEQSLGGRFEHQGAGPDGHAKLQDTLLTSGPGSQALIISTDGEGRSHAWNVVNQDGKIVYVDPQMGRTSDKPLYAGEGGLFAVPLKSDGTALHPTDRPSSTANNGSHQTAPRTETSPKPETAPRPEATPKPETAPSAEPQPKPEATPRPETENRPESETDHAPRPESEESPKSEEPRPDAEPSGQEFHEPSPHEGLEDVRHIPSLEEIHQIADTLGIPRDELPVMVFVPDGATVSTKFSEYGDGRVGELSEAGGKLTIGKIDGLDSADTTPAAVAISGKGGGAYVKGENGAPDVLVVNQRMNIKDGFPQDQVIQHELGHHKQALDQWSIDKSQNNPALIEYHNILTNEVLFQGDGKKPRLTYQKADGQGGLSSGDLAKIKEHLGMGEDAHLPPSKYWDKVAEMPKNPNEQRLFDEIADAAGRKPYSDHPKVKQNFAKAYLVEHLKAQERAAAAAAAAASEVPPPHVEQPAGPAPEVPPPFVQRPAGGPPEVPPPFVRQPTGAAPEVPPPFAQRPAGGPPEVPPPFTQRPVGAPPEVPPTHRPVSEASNPFGDQHAPSTGNSPTSEHSNPFGDEHAPSSGNSPTSEHSNPFGDEHAPSSGNSPTSEHSNPFGDEHAGTSELRPDSAPAGLRPDAEPAGLFGPKKPLITGEGLTPEGKKVLHQSPEGPSIVYPPSNSKAASAGKALANKFKSDLPPELKNVSEHLPVKNGSTHQTEGSTASGKPNARIKNNTFKSYLDPATMTLVEPNVGTNIREPLRDAIGRDVAQAYMGNKVLEEAAKLDYRSRETLARQEERRQLLKDLADQNQEQGTWIDGERVQRQLHDQGSAMGGVDRLLNGHGDDAGFPGVVIGEGHTNAATWPFLRDNMRQLKDSGVDTIYLEALRDDAVQHDLDKYLNPNHTGPMPPTLKAAAAKYDQQYQAKLTETLEAAKANNVKVRAVDGYPARTISEDGGVHERARLMNSYAHDTITSDAARNGKYLVVVGASHAHSTTGPGGTGRIPGTADLLGIPAVHLTDGSGTAEAAPNRASGSTDSNNVRVGYLPTPSNHSPAGAPPQHTDATHPSAPVNPGGLGPVHPDVPTPHGSSDHLAGQGPQHDQHEGGTTDHRPGNEHDSTGKPQHEGGTTDHRPGNEHDSTGKPQHEGGTTDHRPGSEHDSTGKPQHEGGPRHPASDGRPFEVEGGLKRPSEHEQQQLHDAVPKNTDGTPQRHPDPRVGDWLKKLNGGEPHTANQKNNCLDAALAMVDTVNGHPTVAAPRLEGNGLGEKGGRDRAEQSLGGRFEHLGAGPDGHAKLAEMLVESGHGSQAVITSRDSEGRTHAWHAMNHEGQIVYSDPQLGRTSDKPLYAGEGGLFAIPLTPDRAPLHPASQSPGDHSAPAQPAGVGGNSRQGNSVSDAVAMAKKAEADRTAVAQRKREQLAREKQHTSEEGLANLPDRTKQRLAEQQKVTAQQDDLAGRQSELRKQQQGLADEQWALAEKRFTSNNRQLEAEQRRVEEHQERLEQQQERLAGQQERLTQQHDRMARHEALDGQAERAAEKQKQDQAPGEGDKPPVKGELDVRRETLVKDQKLLDQEHGALDAKQAELDARRDKLVADGDKLAEDRAALAKRRREGGADSRKAVADDQKKLDGRQARLDTERKKVDADQHALGETRESLNQRQKWLDKSEWLVDQHGRLTEQELQAKRDNWPEDRLKALADRRERLDKWSAEQAKSELKAKTGAPDEGKWLADKQKWLEGQRDGEGKWHSADQKARLKEQLDVLEELKDSASKPEKQQEQLRQQERLLDERNRLSENRELLEDRQKHQDGDPEQLKWEGERLAHEQGLNDAARQALASGYAGETDPAPFEAPQRYTRVKSGEKGYYYKDAPKKLMNVSIEGAFDVMNDSGSAMANGIAGDKFRPGCVASGLYIDGQSGARRLLVVTASSTKGLAGETAPQHVHPLVKFAYGKEGDPAYDRVKRELGWDSYPAGNPNTRCKCAEPSVMTDILEQVGGRFPGINMNDPVAVGRAMEYARGILGKAFVRPLETGALKDSTGGRVPGYGEYKAPCDNCAPVVGYFGMKSVQLLD